MVICIIGSGEVGFRMSKVQRKCKILLIAKSLGGGGSETAMIEFINYFPTEDYELSVLLLDKDDEYKYRINRDIIVNYIDFDNEFYHSLASMYTLPGKIIKKMQINKFVGMYDMLANHAKAPLESYDIALDFYGYGAFTTAFLALKVDAKVKATWIHDEYMPWLANSKRYFDKIDKICCVSDAIKTVFDVKFPNYTDKSLVIYNVIDKERIIQQSNTGYPEEFKKDTFNILTVGRLTEQKGYDVALKAAKILKEKGINFKWYALGIGRDYKKLEKLILNYELKDFFYLLGRRDNPYLYIKNCDLYVQPSRHEGYSVAVTEARILNKVIIVSNIPSNAEQIHDKVTGLISELNAEAFADTIFRIYTDNELRKRILSNVQEVEINFDAEINKIGKMFEEYELAKANP